MKLEIRIAERAHFGTVESLDFHFLADAKGCNQVTHFEPHIGHRETEHGHSASVDYLHDELREVAIEQSTNAVRAVQFHEIVADNAVPARAILPRCKYTDGDHAPESVDSVNRNRAHRIIDAAPLPEENGFNYQPSGHQSNDGSRPGIDECAWRGDRDKTSEHTVAAHGWIRLEAFQHQSSHRGERTDDSREHSVYNNITNAQVCACKC